MFLLARGERIMNWKRRALVVLVMLIAITLTGISWASHTETGCVVNEVEWTFYADPAKTQVIGYWHLFCDGSRVRWGELNTTPYSTYIVLPCGC
jgi:hypothetical protein